MAYSSTLSTRMWNCSAVSCSTVLLDNFLNIGCDANSRLRFERSLRSGSPGTRTFIEKVGPYASGVHCLFAARSASLLCHHLSTVQALLSRSLSLPLPLLLSSGRRFRFGGRGRGRASSLTAFARNLRSWRV